MTERWRKRLGKLDDVSPSDDVFERAKTGPQLPEEMVPRPKATTRVATAIAAFVVFALAISVFAIPALRMRDDGAGTVGTAGIQPLWPYHTIEEAKAAQDQFESMAYVGTALDPEAVARSFAVDVLGWHSGAILIAPAGGIFDGATYPSSGSPQPCWGNCNSWDPTVPYYNPPCPEWNVDQQCPGGLATIPATSGSPPATTASGTLSGTVAYTIYPCDSLCEYRADPSLLAETVTLYQPAGVGEGKLWAVLAVRSRAITLSASPGDDLVDGVSLAASVLRFPEDHPILAAAGAGDCSYEVATDAFGALPSVGGFSLNDFQASGARLDLDLTGSPCDRGQAGYVFAATSSVEFVWPGPGDLVDPIDKNPGFMLTSLTAAPVILEFPAAPQSPTGETPTQVTVPPTSPTPDGGSTVAVAVGTYTDQLGWTIDVPDTWRRDVVDGVFDGRTTSTGALFSSGAPQVIPGPMNFPGNPVPPDDGVMMKIWHRDGGPAQTYEDDSSFPLSPDDLQPDANVAGAQEMTFRGDGLEFQLEVQYGQNADVASLRPLVDHMIGSIAFQPWQVGDTRNGLTALETPKASTQWVPFGDSSKRVILLQTASGYVALGPVTCDENGTTATSWDPSTACPDSMPLSTWDANGQPDPNNAPGFQHPLPVHPVVLSWDGALLSTLDVTIG
jgi:hypothetical protein